MTNQEDYSKRLDHAGKSSKTSNTRAILGGMFLGAAIGTTLGILFAPYSGNKTREKIASGAKEMADDLKKRMNDEVQFIQAKVDKMMNRTEAKVEAATNGIKEKLESYKVAKN